MLIAKRSAEGQIILPYDEVCFDLAFMRPITSAMTPKACRKMLQQKYTVQLGITEKVTYSRGSLMWNGNKKRSIIGAWPAGPPSTVFPPTNFIEGSTLLMNANSAAHRLPACLLPTIFYNLIRPAFIGSEDQTTNIYREGRIP